jgi:hypothetical protein
MVGSLAMLADVDLAGMICNHNAEAPALSLKSEFRGHFACSMHLVSALRDDRR